MIFFLPFPNYLLRRNLSAVEVKFIFNVWSPENVNYNQSIQCKYADIRKEKKKKKKYNKC